MWAKKLLFWVLNTNDIRICKHSGGLLSTLSDLALLSHLRFATSPIWWHSAMKFMFHMHHFAGIDVSLHTVELISGCTSDAHSELSKMAGNFFFFVRASEVMFWLSFG